VKDGDLDEFIEPLLVISGNRTEVEIQDLPAVFRPVTGKHKIQGSLLHRISMEWFTDQKQICIKYTLTTLATMATMVEPTKPTEFLPRKVRSSSCVLINVS